MKNILDLDSVVYLKYATDNLESLLKIGFTSNKFSRYNCSYDCGNLSDYISEVRGDYTDELAIQLYFRKYLYTKRDCTRKESKEIFINTEDIISQFKSFKEGLEEVYIQLWKDRGDIFKINDIKDKETRKHEVLNRAIKIVSPSEKDLDFESRLDLAIFQIL